MAILSIQNNTGSSVTIKGTSYSDGSYVPIPYIETKPTLAREKLWGSDSGRTLAGTYKGTLTGIFSKLTYKVTGSRLTYKDVAAICALCDQETAYCKWYNPKTSSFKTSEFYFDSVTITPKYVDESDASNNRYDAINIVAVAISKE